jgi:ergothioneine biosynthesis protein EgtB
VLDRDAIAARYRSVRARTEALAAPLSAEDAMVQSMPDASPTKWHLAHTTWFFEEFVLARFERGHRWPDERWRVLFNSYYEAVGPRHARAARGVLSRPALDEVRAWRRLVDERVGALLARAAGPSDEAALAVVLLGTHHEEQHQELLLTDAKHALSCSELRPAYTSMGMGGSRQASPGAPPLRWATFDESIAHIGNDGNGDGGGTAFVFDNETARHATFVGAFALGSRLVTNAEYAAFIGDGGYDRAELWLSDGWAAARDQGWRAPLYWERAGQGTDAWHLFGMRGMEALDPHAPVIHVSYYEADAYARWARARLPTEQEWESVAQNGPVRGGFLEGGSLAPMPAAAAPPAAAGPGPVRIEQLFGDAWEWTASAYSPYPRFRAGSGALGEYNGKFMSGQMVLRGGSCFSPQAHLRATYRNFFPPAARWQVSGIRLARDV